LSIFELVSATTHKAQTFVDDVMARHEHDRVIRHQTAQAVLRNQFLKWQCRARQNAVRTQSGRPSPPMRPRIIVERKALAQVTVLINKREEYSMTPEFRHLVRGTADPRDRLQNALQVLAAEYFQRAQEFSDQMTALFGAGAPLVNHLVGLGHCILEFAQPRQYYAIPCAVKNLAEHDPAYQATYWHNYLFNPAMPPGVQVLAFKPDWATAEADPSPA
jgi:hypothetical protein